MSTDEAGTPAITTAAGSLLTAGALTTTTTTGAAAEGNGLDNGPDNDVGTMIESGKETGDADGGNADEVEGEGGGTSAVTTVVVPLLSVVLLALFGYALYSRQRQAQKQAAADAVEAEIQQVTNGGSDNTTGMTANPMADNTTGMTANPMARPKLRYQDVQTVTHPTFIRGSRGGAGGTDATAPSAVLDADGYVYDSTTNVKGSTTEYVHSDES